ncbi:MAG: hypothetical protein WC817_04755 [Patescibacteria group bacterium]|jgi:hypothetical protein
MPRDKSLSSYLPLEKKSFKGNHTVSFNISFPQHEVIQKLFRARTLLLFCLSEFINKSESAGGGSAFGGKMTPEGLGWGLASVSGSTTMNLSSAQWRTPQTAWSFLGSLSSQTPTPIL